MAPYIPSLEQEYYKMDNTDYFSRFTGFVADASGTIDTEFTRLAQHRGWGPKKARHQRAICYEAEFRRCYGSDGSALAQWRILCHEVRAAGPLESITQCKKALGRVHVNLVDLLNCRRTGQPVHRFPNKKSLQEYTRHDHTKVFPKWAAKQEGFLRALLRDIFH